MWSLFVKLSWYAQLFFLYINLLSISSSYRQDTRPSLKTEHTKAQLKRILLEVLDSGAKAGFFGSVPSSGKVGTFSNIRSLLPVLTRTSD